MLLEGQVAVVTGAAQGIGKAIALRVAREGADIALVDLNSEGAESTAREVRGLGRRAHVDVADVSDPGAVDSAIAEISDAFERLDILVNNAGIEKRPPFLDITPSDWRRQPPGPVETELMLGVWSAEALRERLQHGAIARFGTVDEIAHTALFLAAPESGFITGITISVDGGAVAAGAYMVEKYRRRKAETAAK
jgi:meso-butanediol dehydrogenase/(S,S)-butanediol dehydrogenase/diacetyl reductase